MRMRPWNQLNGECTQEVKCQSLYNDNKRRQGFKSMVG